jgi:hypothetical protein
MISRIGWNEMRTRATQFSKDWAGAFYEKGETQTFYNEFFNIFGLTRRDVYVYYEKKITKLNNTTGFIDVFWPGKLLVEQKSLGRDLKKARDQATDYFLALKDEERPRYILLSDFQTFELLDLETREENRFSLSDLPKNIRLFAFIAGLETKTYKDQDEANIRAAWLMGQLHERLEESGYTGASLERFLVRVMFCLFADDTGMFAVPDLFIRYMDDRTAPDGTDVGPKLIQLFEVLNTPEDKRQTTLDEDLARFPYVNGGLFADPIRTPSFNTAMREALLQCCLYDWSKVSPALFGSLFQTVMLPEEQRKGGAHYTSERNILKTIHPLFLDDLRAEFVKIRDSKSSQRPAQLQRFLDKLANLTFFDPACGCGNFLILAYRELRLLETEVLQALYPPDQQKLLDVTILSRVDVDQFYGIEIEEFAARIAETAIYLVDHQMNVKLGALYGDYFARLPLKKSAHIHHGNALTTDWKTVIAPETLSYILGNPPFVGKNYQTPEQKKDMQLIFANVKSAGNLDYVTAWFLKAAQYIQGTDIKVAFVSTNSITQGEQVSVLWQPLLQKYGIHIHFAHRTFKWTLDEKRARGMTLAAVYVVIIGFAAHDTDHKTLFDYETITSDPVAVPAQNINPYLVDGPAVMVERRTRPLCDVPEMVKGSQPTDGGNLLLSAKDKEEFIAKEPLAEPWIRQYAVSDDLINGLGRYCLWLVDCPPDVLRQMPEVMKRIEAVRKMRLASPKEPTRRDAATSSLFTEIRQSKTDYLAVPRVSSERRHYIPLTFASKDLIAGDALQTIPDATPYHFGVLTSLMHNAWMRQVAGRLESRYRYSNTVVYNNFPWPTPTPAQETAITEKAQAILTARAQFPSSTLADLYDPLTMPPVLLRAHQALDRAVDAAYRRAPFTTERERVAFLFERYQALVAPLVPKEKRGRGKAKRGHV